MMAALIIFGSGVAVGAIFKDVVVVGWTTVVLPAVKKLLK